MKPVKICDLDISHKEKAGLTRSFEGATATALAVAMDVGLCTTYQRIRIWVEKGWVTREKRGKFPDGIQLNEKRLRL